MNSHQRRKDRKRWRYEVYIEWDRVDDNGYDNMFDWCRETFGTTVATGWREKHGHIGTCWQFTNKPKAVLFSLRWR